jgi:hypothetical protein
MVFLNRAPHPLALGTENGTGTCEVGVGEVGGRVGDEGELATKSS